MRIPIEIQRRIVRYITEQKMSNRQIGELLKVAPNTVRAVRLKLNKSDENWSTLVELDNTTFTQRLGTMAVKPLQRGKPIPDWNYISAELQKRDVTLVLLWQEFREVEPTGISYSRMSELFSLWVKNYRISMRQLHRAGEKFFVDFCGRTVDIHHQQTGEVFKAYIFVGVFGASGFITALAVSSQTIPNWQKCHIEIFKQVGGVPQQVVPDNLKSAVIRNTPKGILFNRSFAELAEHYNFAILPARPRKPKDKPLAEVSVKIVQMGILARLRNRKFFSLDELNDAIKPLLADINAKTTPRFQKSRLERFLEIDAPALQPLPETLFEPCTHIYQVRVSEYYQVEFKSHYYSVPYQYAHQKVDLRITEKTIEVIFERQRIASHLLHYEIGGQTVNPDHMPPHHRFQFESDPEHLLAWAESVGSLTHVFATRLLRDRRDFANGLKALQRIRRWVYEENYIDYLEDACGYALRINAVSQTSLKSILKQKTHLKSEQPTLSTISKDHQNLRGASYFNIHGESSC